MWVRNLGWWERSIRKHQEAKVFTSYWLNGDLEIMFFLGFMKYLISLNQIFDTGLIYQRLKVTQTTGYIRSSMNCGILQRAYQSSEILLFTGCYGFIKLKSTGRFNVNWLNVTNISGLWHRDSVVWMLLEINACESELAHLFASKREYLFQFSYLFLKPGASSPQTVINMDSKDTFYFLRLGIPKNKRARTEWWASKPDTTKMAHQPGHTHFWSAYIIHGIQVALQWLTQVQVQWPIDDPFGVDPARMRYEYQKTLGPIFWRLSFEVLAFWTNDS